MSIEMIFQSTLLLATFLCTLVAGFLFAFAVVVMPGLKVLNDRGFISAFQAIDGVIQNHQPIFLLVWVGSVVALVLSVFLSFSQLHEAGRLFMIAVTLVYVLGVQIPTMTINVPLNNSLQELDIHTMNEAEHKNARDNFEPRWNRWNTFRTLIASLVSILLLILLIIL